MRAPVPVPVTGITRGSDRTVEPFTQDVGVASVPTGLGKKVDEDVEQGHLGVLPPGHAAGGIESQGGALPGARPAHGRDWDAQGRGIRSDLGSGRFLATLTVDRQLVGISGRVPFFGPPKTAASVRVIPLPTVVVDGLAAHLAAFPSDTLVFMNESGDMIRRSNFGTMWRRVTKSVDLEGLHFHDLRHYYASLLIRHGESVKTVQARLGHANAAETLDTYSHLWPDSDDRTREAVDLVLADFLADSVRTGVGDE